MSTDACLGKDTVVLKVCHNAGNEHAGLQRARDVSRSQHQCLLASGCHIPHTGDTNLCASHACAAGVQPPSALIQATPQAKGRCTTTP
jgi:hypothetical protein